LRAARYGIFSEVESFAKENGLYNFAMKLVRGKDMAQLRGTSYSARKAVLAKPLQKELYAAKLLEENGYTVYFTPENTMVKRMKNYDAIIDGRLGEFKKLESFGKIRAQLNDADKKGAVTVCLELPMKNHTFEEATSEINRWFRYSQHKIEFVDTVLLIWGGSVIPLKKQPLFK
jgi:hypothetical protein